MVSDLSFRQSQTVNWPCKLGVIGVLFCSQIEHESEIPTLPISYTLDCLVESACSTYTTEGLKTTRSDEEAFSLYCTELRLIIKRGIWYGWISLAGPLSCGLNKLEAQLMGVNPMKAQIRSIPISYRARYATKRLDPPKKLHTAFEIPTKFSSNIMLSLRPNWACTPHHGDLGFLAVAIATSKFSCLVALSLPLLSFCIIMHMLE